MNNKERAINILLEHAIRSTDPKDDAYAPDTDGALSWAILVIQRDIEKNRVDTNVPVKGVSSNVKKGI